MLLESNLKGTQNKANALHCHLKVIIFPKFVSFSRCSILSLSVSIAIPLIRYPVKRARDPEKPLISTQSASHRDRKIIAI